MFTPSTWYFLSREIVDIWKQLEEKTNEQQTHQLTKYANNPSNWYKKQLEGIPNFQKVIEKLGDEELKRINKASEKAIKKAIDLVDNEILKTFRVKETKQEIRQDKERFIASSVKKVINQNEGKMNAFVRTASVRNGEFVNQINVKKESTAKIKTQFTVNTKTQELYDIIRKQTEEGIQKGVPFTYSNGRRVPFKAHMEMSIRTTIQNEALERMTTAASNLGIIFYLASEHADSADDHANFQGKIYVLENWESKITDSETREKVRNFIREKDIRTIEWVKGEPVWFNTRPNCRHYFIPITIEQAMGNLNNLKRNLRTKKGTYREENYQDLKLQRHNERQIRFYKERAKNNEILLARTKDPYMQSQLRNQITRDKRLTRDWQARQRGLLKSNPNLERNYRRESTEKMAQDLGVKLHLKGGKSLPNVPKNDTIEYSEAAKVIIKACENRNVEFKQAGKLKKHLTANEIIKKLSGGDKTKGSCSSLALAYIGNKNRLDVTDYRGGSSQKIFSKNYILEQIQKLDGVKGSAIKVKKELAGTIDILRDIELNKEYYLATGKHAAIVRKNESGVEYLELQSSNSNGWKSFQNETYGSIWDTLHKRFGCRKTVDRSFGRVWKRTVVLMEVDSFSNNTDFEHLLGYINTETSKQKKGEDGNVK